MYIPTIGNVYHLAKFHYQSNDYLSNQEHYYTNYLLKIKKFISSFIFSYNLYFCPQLNLQFSELNITPSVRPNFGIFKIFWYWISIFRQSSWVKKTQFELNLTSFKWASPRSALSGLPRLSWEYVLKDFCFTSTYEKMSINTKYINKIHIEHVKWNNVLQKTDLLLPLLPKYLD